MDWAQKIVYEFQAANDVIVPIDFLQGNLIVTFTDKVAPDYRNNFAGWLIPRYELPGVGVVTGDYHRFWPGTHIWNRLFPSLPIQGYKLIYRPSFWFYTRIVILRIWEGVP